ncbi:MAG: exopolysaccharide biosynthesis polyprenyl glycosylphosphotransferase [Verrucomicrobiota bacterium]
MIKNRINGICLSLILWLLLSNILLFHVWITLAEHRILLDLNPNANARIYMIGIFAAILFGGRHFYEFRSRIIRLRLFEIGQLAFRLSMIFAVSTAFIYITLKDSPISRWFLLTYLMVFTLVNIISLKWLPRRLAHRLFPRDETARYYFLFGDSVPPDLRDHLMTCRDQYGFNVQGYFSDVEQNDLELEHGGNFKDFVRLMKTRKIRPEGVLIFCNNFKGPSFLEVIEICQQEGVRLQIYSDFFNLFENQVEITSDGSLHYFAPLEEPLENPIHRLMKRALDLAISVPVVLFVLLPLFPLVWLMQRIHSPGPVLFKQQRYGLRRREFTIFKFRTMHTRPPEADDEGVQASESDSRVFGFGAFLRRTSLDELPQFLNVIRGEMSVVGPRPHLVQHEHDFEKHYLRYRCRHFVKPGITGEAQIRGFRGEIRTRELLTKRIQCDLYYIHRWTIWLDLYIIARTAFQIFFPPRTAY